MALLTPHLAISTGAVLGGSLRYFIGSLAAAAWGTSVPYGTLLVNITGSLVIGFYLTRTSKRPLGGSTWRLLLATGFLGAYTTFSAFTYETVSLLRNGAAIPALIYAASSLALSLAAAAVGGLVADRS